MATGLTAVLAALGMGAASWKAATSVAQQEARREMPYEQRLDGLTVLTGTPEQVFEELAAQLEQVPEAERQTPEATHFVNALLELLWNWPKGEQSAGAARLLQVVLTGGFKADSHMAWQGWYVLNDYFRPEVQVGMLLLELRRSYLYRQPEEPVTPDTRFYLRHQPILESVGEHESGSFLCSACWPNDLILRIGLRTPLICCWMRSWRTCRKRPLWLWPDPLNGALFWKP